MVDVQAQDVVEEIVALRDGTEHLADPTRVAAQPFGHPCSTGDPARREYNNAVRVP